MPFPKPHSPRDRQLACWVAAGAVVLVSLALAWTGQGRVTAARVDHTTTTLQSTKAGDVQWQVSRLRGTLARVAEDPASEGRKRDARGDLRLVDRALRAASSDAVAGDAATTARAKVDAATERFLAGVAKDPSGRGSVDLADAAIARAVRPIDLVATRIRAADGATGAALFRADRDALHRVVLALLLGFVALVAIARQALRWRAADAAAAVAARDHGSTATASRREAVEPTPALDAGPVVVAQQVVPRATGRPDRIAAALEAERRRRVTSAANERIARMAAALAQVVELPAEVADALRSCGPLLDDPTGATGAVATWLAHRAESWDGSGTPGALAGRGIPLPSRVLRVAEAVELAGTGAGTAARVGEVTSVLRDLAGEFLDPTLVEIACVLLAGGQLAPAGAPGVAAA